MNAVAKQRRIGDVLIEKGILTPDQLRIVLKEQRKCGQKLGQVAVALGLTTGKSWWFAIAIVVQYGGLVAERWFFFAQANHPQNLYYQTVG